MARLVSALKLCVHDLSETVNERELIHMVLCLVYDVHVAVQIYFV